MMVNMALLRDTRALQLLTAVECFVLLFNLASFWAVYYWPVVTTGLGLYFVFRVWYAVRQHGRRGGRRDSDDRDGYGSSSPFEIPQWMHFGLFILMFLGILQLAVAIILIVIEDDVGEATRIFQYISAVTGPFITLATFLWRTSLMRVFAGIGRATQGGDLNVNPRMHVALSPREEMERYVEDHPNFGHSVHAERNGGGGGPLRIAGFADYAHADDDGGYTYGAHPTSQRYGGGGLGGSRSDLYDYGYVNAPQQQQQQKRFGSPYGGQQRSVPPTAADNEIADVYTFERDARTGRPLLVSHTASIPRGERRAGTPNTYAYGINGGGNGHPAFTPRAGAYAYGPHQHLHQQQQQRQPFGANSDGRESIDADDEWRGGGGRGRGGSTYGGSPFGSGRNSPYATTTGTSAAAYGGQYGGGNDASVYHHGKSMPAAFVPGGSNRSAAYSPAKDPYIIASSSSMHVPGGGGAAISRGPTTTAATAAPFGSPITSARPAGGSPMPYYPDGYVGQQTPRTSRPQTPNSQQRRVTFAPY